MAQRRLVVLLDGTWSASTTRTNVERLWQLIAPCDHAGREQITQYIPGVGVTPGLDHLLGGAFGLGLSDSVCDGYLWLSVHWQPGDEVFLFGFSRGAYAARSLAGMIHKCGLLKPDVSGAVAQSAVDDAYAFYRKNLGADDPQSLAFRTQRSRVIEIVFVGVWETVGDLGIPDVASWFPYARNRYRFHDTALSDIVRHAYQALALDEYRADFAPTKWTEVAATSATQPAQTVVEQRWFVGAHSDIGGGDKTDGGGRSPDLLPDIALAWMRSKAVDAGLAFNEPFAPAPHAELATPNDSYRQFMYGLYRLLKKPVARAIGGGINETIDESVWLRWREVPAYRPASLISALQAKVIAAPLDIVP